MPSKLGAALVCLVFALPFGGVGVGASWVLYHMLYDGHRAEDWVRVKATVDAFDRGSVSYRYKFRDVEYSGDRLGANPIGGTDDIDSWHDEMYSMLSTAKGFDKPIMVWVNPDNPGESMVDRTIRWKLAAVTVPFALGFGGVGIGALFMFFRTLLRPAEEVKANPDPLMSLNPRPGSGALSTWIFAFFWNAISIPIAIVIVPGAIANGQWAALFVLIFPLIGVLLIWGAVAATVRSIRARFTPSHMPDAFPAASSASRPMNDGVFARGMLSDGQGGATIDTMDDGMPDATPGMVEKLFGRKLDDGQRASLRDFTAKLTPAQRAAVVKSAAWLPNLKYVFYGIIGLVVFLEFIWPAIRLFTRS